MRQLAIATHNFHDTYGDRLPPGAGNDMAPFGRATGAHWGSSWMVYILPFIEQNNIYDKWDFNSHSGYNHAANASYINNVWIKAYRCPSSAVPDFFNRSGTAARMMVVSYTGIAGSAVTPGSSGTYAQACCNGSGSYASDNGIFFGASKTGFSGITDGTSNTWLIGEQSAHVRDANNRPITAGYTAGTGNSGGLYGWTMGAAVPANGSHSTWTSDGRHFNCTAVRFRINQNGFPADSATSATNGLNNDVGGNFPLSSYHPAGVNMALADASTRFYSNSLDLTVIHAMCTKAGGETLNAE